MMSSLLIACGGNDTQESKKETKDSTAQAANTAYGAAIKLDPLKKYVYLTVDDGPQPPGTNNCIDIFKKEGVKATFFMVGLHNQISPSRANITKQVRASYPQLLLANHSFTHGFRDKYRTFYASVDSAYADFLAAEKELNVPVKIIRLPGMNTWVTSTITRGPQSSMAVANKLKDNGFKIIGWDVEWNFVKGSTPKQGAEEMAQELLDKLNTQNTVESNAIVLLAHDRMFAKQQYADSLTKFIQILKQDPNIVFETIDHYPSVQN